MSLDDVPIEILQYSNLPRFEDGRINFKNSKSAPVLNCFVVSKKRILLVKRGNKVGWLKNRWHVVAGFLDEEVPLKKKVLEEIHEELDIIEKQILGMRQLPTITAEEPGKHWFIYRAVAEVGDVDITLDWENTEFRWVNAEESEQFVLTPTVARTVQELLELGLLE